MTISVLDEADLRGSDGSLRPESVCLATCPATACRACPGTYRPHWSARYEHPLPGVGNWYVNGDYTYESSKFAQEHNLIENRRPESGWLAFRTRWLVAGMRVSGQRIFSMMIRRLTSLRYFDRRFGTLPSFPQQGPGAREQQSAGLWHYPAARPADWRYRPVPFLRPCPTVRAVIRS